MIVAGVDYSEDSRRALLWAAAEGRVLRAPVTAVHAGPPVFDLVSHTPYAEQRRAELLPALESFVGATLGTDPPIACEIVDGPPSAGLSQFATEADLLVVGRHGHSAIARFLMGSTSHSLVRHATCPVAVVPRTAGTGPVRRVVVGTDGSEAATHALHWAAAEAMRRNVPLLVVHASPPPVTTVMPMAGTLPMYPSPEAGHAFLDDVVAKTVAETGGLLAVESTVSSLAPAPALLTAAGPDDLLVVGSSGIGAVARALLGSTSAVVAEQSTGVVVVVPWRRSS